MDLTTDMPDVSTWRHHLHDTLVVDGVSIPSVERDVYRLAPTLGAADEYSCAVYTHEKKPLMVVWGVMGVPDCCRYHRVRTPHGELGDSQTGAPDVEYNPEEKLLRINNFVLSV
jgi:hypothetical protein